MKGQWQKERRARRHSHSCRPWVKFHKTVADVSDLYGVLPYLTTDIICGAPCMTGPMQALGFFVPSPQAKV